MLKITAFILTSFMASFLYVGTVSAVDVFDNKDAKLCTGAQLNAKENDANDDGSPLQPSVCKDKKIQTSDGEDVNPIFGPKGVLTSLINILSLVAAIAAIIVIILAGLRFVTSSTNSQDVTNARERIIYALVGLVVASMAQIFVRFIIGKVDLL